MPKLCVLMPVYNAEAYLRQSIDSILSQTFDDFEFLIINDASADTTVSIIESFRDNRIRLLHNKKNIGLAASLNFGIESTSCEYIARMDGDDISLSNRLSRQIEFMDAHPNIGISGTWARTFGAGNRMIRKQPAASDEIHCWLLFKSAVNHPTAIIRRAMLEKHNLRFDPDFRSAQDYDLWARAAEVFAFGNIPEVLLEYRMHSDQLSAIHSAERPRRYLQVVARQLARLNVPYTDDDMAIHRKLLTNAFTDAGQINKLESWLLRLKEANAIARVYDIDTFSSVLGNVWFNACNAAAALGSVAWQSYSNSVLSRRGRPSRWQLTRFALKCRVKPLMKE